MPIVVVVLIVFVVVAASAWAIYRRGADQHSVQGYQQTLDALQGIRARSTPNSVRVLGSSSGLPLVSSGGGAGPGPQDAGGPPTKRAESSDGQPERLVFSDLTPTDDPLGRDIRSTHRSKDRAIVAMNNRPRRLAGPVLAGSIVIAFLVVLAIIGAHGPRTHPALSQHSTGPTISGSRSQHGAKGAPGHGRTHATTTTTSPSVFRPVTATSASATYEPPLASYTVNITATTGPCWVQVQSASGATSFAGTLNSGQQRSFPLTGVVNVTLGAPSAVTVALDNEPVIFPATYANPFHMTFQPPSVTPTTSTTTTLVPSKANATPAQSPVTTSTLR